MIIDVDGSNPHTVGSASGAADDWVWGDIAWSREDWILFVVGQTVNGSFCNSRVDKMRPDGSERTQVTDGGSSCTVPAGLPASSLVTELVPKGSPQGSPNTQRILLFRACFDDGAASAPGIYVTDTTGSYRSFVVSGFGPDWNPVAAQ